MLLAGSHSCVAHTVMTQLDHPSLDWPASAQRSNGSFGSCGLFSPRLALALQGTYDWRALRESRSVGRENPSHLLGRDLSGPGGMRACPAGNGKGACARDERVLNIRLRPPPRVDIRAARGIRLHRPSTGEQNVKIIILSIAVFAAVSSNTAFGQTAQQAEMRYRAEAARARSRANQEEQRERAEAHRQQEQARQAAIRAQSHHY